jgi:hypothetical protein
MAGYILPFKKQAGYSILGRSKTSVKENLQ